MKAYTDVNQSKKLAEILPIGSNDMYYEPSAGFNTQPSEVRIGDIKYAHPLSIPCWSLTALLEEMNRNNYNIFLRNNADLTWTISFNDSERYIDVYGNDPVDICFEMIIKLHEQKFL